MYGFKPDIIITSVSEMQLSFFENNDFLIVPKLK